MPSSATPQLDLLTWDESAEFTDAMAKKVFGTVYVPTFSAKISHGDQKARSTDPVVSHDAAESMEGHAKHQEAVLLKVFRAYEDAYKGLTAEEAGRLAGFDAWRRTSDLLKAGKLVDTGRTRANASGRKARVLRCP